MEGASARRVEEAVEEEVGRRFDLRHELPVRAKVLRLGEERHVLVLVMHHIALGWVVEREVGAGVFASAYWALAGRAASGSGRRLRVQYADYAPLAAGGGCRSGVREGGWVLEGEVGRAAGGAGLPLDKVRPGVQRFEGRRCSAAGWVERWSGAAEGAECQRRGATLFMGLLAAFRRCCRASAGRRTSVVGTPMANRTSRRWRASSASSSTRWCCGCEPDGRSELPQLLQQVRQTALGAYAHQEVPFEKVVEALQPQRRPQPLAPLPGHAFAAKQCGGAATTCRGWKSVARRLGDLSARIDLTLDVDEAGDGLGLNWQYDTALFDASHHRGGWPRLFGHPAPQAALGSDVERPI